MKNEDATLLASFFTVRFDADLQEDSFLDRECCLHPDQYPVQASKGGFLRAFRHAEFYLLMLLNEVVRFV